MEKKKGVIKGFFEEFKKFITRGNVLDMAVGVIVGGAFTAIVNGLSNNILKPIVNWLIALILGKQGLSGAITMLSPSYKEVTTVLADGTEKIVQELDLASSIYIDWGAFVSSIINFLIIAFVLFVIVKIMNRLNEAREKAVSGIDFDEQLEIVKLCREQKISKKSAKKIIEEKKVEFAKQKEAEEKAAAEEAARVAAEEAALAELKATANTRLLEEIRDLLKNK